jgi:hypothetical protein
MSTEQVTPGLVEAQGIGEEPLFYFTRVYLLFLQGLFGDMEPGSYKWSSDEKLTEISITDQAAIPKDRIGQRPHIVTMRGPAQYARLSLDQMLYVDPRTGAKTRSDLVACTMTLNCIAKNGVEAQRIAWQVMRGLRSFKEMIQREGKMHMIGEDVSIGPESPPGAMVAGEADPECVMVTVHSPFFFQWKETVTPLDGQRLSHIELHIRAGLSNPAALTTAAAVRMREVIGAPTIRGRVINSAPSYPSSPIDQKVET